MSQQDQMFINTVRKKEEKQQALRENIKETIKASMPYVVWNNEDYYDGFVDHILQNVIEWVDKEVIGEDCEYQFMEEYENPNELRATQRQKLQQLKEEV